MGRPAKWCSQRGLLLVEAVLSAVVIATGLVFISRGLAGQLKALQTLEAYDRLLLLAHGRLTELETALLARRPTPLKEGRFEEPYAGYRWSVSAVRRQDVPGTPSASDVTLIVADAASTSPGLKLAAIWPTEWLPQEWFQ